MGILLILVQLLGGFLVGSTCRDNCARVAIGAGCVTSLVNLLVLGALSGLFVAVDTPALPVSLGMLAGAGAGALLALVLDGTQPDVQTGVQPAHVLRHPRWRH